MREYEQHEEEMEIPKGSGIPGFLQALKGVLSLPRVSDVRINAQGKITYTFFLRKGEAMNKLAVNFGDVMPYAIVRNGVIDEISNPSWSAVVACAQMMEAAARDHMYPVGFLGSQTSSFWNWYEEGLGNPTSTRDELFGYPFFFDAQLEEHALLLCTAYRRGGSITDTVKSYKVTVPQVRK
jgi:hypothetical protein